MARAFWFYLLEAMNASEMIKIYKDKKINVLHCINIRVFICKISVILVLSTI